MCRPNNEVSRGQEVEVPECRPWPLLTQLSAPVKHRQTKWSRPLAWDCRHWAFVSLCFPFRRFITTVSQTSPNKGLAVLFSIIDWWIKTTSQSWQGSILFKTFSASFYMHKQVRLIIFPSLESRQIYPRHIVDDFLSVFTWSVGSYSGNCGSVVWLVSFWNYIILYNCRTFIVPHAGNMRKEAVSYLFCSSVKSCCVQSWFTQLYAALNIICLVLLYIAKPLVNVNGTGYRLVSTYLDCNLSTGENST